MEDNRICSYTHLLVQNETCDATMPMNDEVKAEQHAKLSTPS